MDTSVDFLTPSQQQERELKKQHYKAELNRGYENNEPIGIIVTKMTADGYTREERLEMIRESAYMNDPAVRAPILLFGIA